MASTTNLNNLTVLLVGDDIVTTKLETSLTALGPDVERASAALATEVMQMAAPDLVVVSPTAATECGSAVTEVVQAGISPARVFLVCNSSRAQQMGLVDSDGIAILDPRLGANRIAQLAEKILPLGNDAAGRSQMAEIIAAAHGRKPGEIRKQPSAPKLTIPKPSANKIPNEGTRPRFRMPTGANPVPAAQASRAAAPLTTAAAPKARPISTAKKSPAGSPPVQRKSTASSQNKTPKIHARKPIASLAAVAQTAPRAEHKPVGTPATATHRAAAAPAAPKGPTPLSALLANSGPATAHRELTSATAAANYIADASRTSAPDMMQDIAHNKEEIADVLSVAPAMSEEVTVVSRTMAQRADVERMQARLAATDPASIKPPPDEYDEFEVAANEVSTANEQPEHSAKAQPFAFAATMAMHIPVKGDAALDAQFDSAEVGPPPMQNSPSLPVELAVLLEDEQPQQSFPPSVRPSAAPPTAQQAEHSLVAPQAMSVARERISQVSNSLAKLTASGYTQGGQAVRDGGLWLKTQWERVDQMYIGNMRLTHVAASAGAALTLVLVLWVSVGGVQPSQTRALASIEIAGKISAFNTPPANTASSGAIAKKADHAQSNTDEGDTDVAQDDLADDADLDEGRVAESSGENDGLSAATQALVADARDLIREGDHRLRERRFGMAEAAYLKALRKIPRYPRALEGVARVHLARKDGREAVRWAAKLVKRQPIRSNNFLLLGDAYALRGNKSAAITAWKRAAKAGNRTAARRLK